MAGYAWGLCDSGETWFGRFRNVADARAQAIRQLPGGTTFFVAWRDEDGEIDRRTLQEMDVPLRNEFETK